MRQCIELGVPKICIERIKQEKRDASMHAGVSLAYILSEDFKTRAQNATGKDDPTFLEMKGPFFLTGSGRIGEGQLCPRDLGPGCAFVDTLPPKHRKKATTFMSWVWQYKLSTVRSCLTRWAVSNNRDPEEVFLYCCFFCNNQWRILVERSSHGSDNLEDVFETRLNRIGEVVALMDSWRNPLYVQRIWTIYEQYIAAKLGIRMQFTLPVEPSATLMEQLEQGKKGIQFVIEAISRVDAEHAKATVEQDEHKVKALIRNSLGFERVNHQVKSSIVEWIAQEFKNNIDKLVQAT